jgi:eukaryotic-like serine/threonine-protein kinase
MVSRVTGRAIDRRRPVGGKNERMEGERPTLTATGDAGDGSGGAPPRGRFGRYVVLEYLGGGAMGDVYSAYDPQLDRKLAIKILRPQTIGNPARLWREAQAMARLQHPNVIGVYDAGIVEGEGFVAMELIDGCTLSAWLENEARPRRDILRAFVQAGRGLAAAHAVGLIHRDFKPANVLVDRDGRVRVGDFGLARSIADVEESDETARPAAATASLQDTITKTGSLLGTPSYMSPEQLRGKAAGTFSDQFSFCVALYRALYGEKPFDGEDVAALAASVTAGRLRPPPKDKGVPGWLRDVVMRGLATEPSARWPSMDALLAALERDPARRIRRGAIAVAVIAAAALEIVGMRALHRRQSLVCSGAGQQLVGVWDGARKQAVQRAFATSGVPYSDAAFASIARALDDFAARWANVHTEACEATQLRHEQSAELLDLRIQCLGQRLQQAKAQVDLLATADAKLVAKATTFASSLPELATCSDAAALRAPVRMPADAAARARIDGVRGEIARTRALILAGRFKDALALAQPAAANARATGYRPLESEALYLLGWLQNATGDAAAGKQSFIKGVHAGRAGRDTAAEVIAWTGLIEQATTAGHFLEAHESADLAVAALESMEVADDHAAVTLYEMLGSLAAAEARCDQQLDYVQRTLALRQKRSGPESLEISFSLSELEAPLECLGRYDEAERDARHGLAIVEKELGPAHPQVAHVLVSLGNVLAREGKFDEALAAERRAIAVWEHAVGPESTWLVPPLVNLGDILRSQGRYEESLAAARHALAFTEKVRGPAHPFAAVARTEVADDLRFLGHPDQAIGEYDAAIAVFEKAYGAAHPLMAVALTGLGEAELDQHHVDRATQTLTRALAMTEKQPDDVAALAQARFAMARAYGETGRERARAVQLATEARKGYADVRRDRELAAVDRWLAAHR